MTIEEAIKYLRDRADEIVESASDHRRRHSRNESQSVRSKKHAQARELKRCAYEIERIHHDEEEAGR